jgi:hypothetical protein
MNGLLFCAYEKLLRLWLHLGVGWFGVLLDVVQALNCLLCALRECSQLLKRNHKFVIRHVDPRLPNVLRDVRSALLLGRDLALVPALTELTSVSRLGHLYLAKLGSILRGVRVIMIWTQRVSISLVHGLSCLKIHDVIRQQRNLFRGAACGGVALRLIEKGKRFVNHRGVALVFVDCVRLLDLRNNLILSALSKSDLALLRRLWNRIRLDAHATDVLYLGLGVQQFRM